MKEKFDSTKKQQQDDFARGPLGRDGAPKEDCNVCNAQKNAAAKKE